MSFAIFHEQPYRDPFALNNGGRNRTTMLIIDLVKERDFFARLLQFLEAQTLERSDWFLNSTNFQDDLATSALHLMLLRHTGANLSMSRGYSKVISGFRRSVRDAIIFSY